MENDIESCTLDDWLKDPGNSQRSIKFPINTVGKRWCLNIAQIFVLLAVLCLLPVFADSVVPSKSEALTMLFVCVAGAFVCFGLYKTYDHYLLNIKTRQLFIYRKLFFVPFHSLVADCSEFAKIAVDAEMRTYGRATIWEPRHWWEYFIVIVLKNGQYFRVSEYKASFFFLGGTSGEDFLIECNQKGEKLAKILKVEFVPGVAKQGVKR